MMTNRTTTVSASRAHSASKARLLARIALALSTALCPIGAMADTLPTGGNVVGGSAQITTPSAGNMAITQHSDRAVVNWDGFSIGAGNRVDITQPGVDSAILNRVTGDTTSQIHGQLNANGRVFVVNPNGIFIGPTGAVKAGGFVASTLGIRTDDFITGKTVFEGNGSSATVSNAGTVEVVTGGYAALIGGKVKNSGTIQAPLGFVGLGSGERITLDLAGDGFLQVAVPTNTDDDGLEALIENSGTIQANGGTVQISAATARNAARHAINMSGVVEARTVSGRNGRVTLGGGSGGKVTVRGKVRTKAARRPVIQVVESARPKMPPQRGGDITITGRDIRLAGAEIDASGAHGGGNIRIGGELQGGPGLITADTLTIDSASRIMADALLNGDGGRVIAWSDLSTDFRGTITVRGGKEAGNGGFAEVSGKIDLNYAGSFNSLAPNGDAGTLLLDPADLEIVGSAPVFNQILDTDLENLLLTTDVVIETTDSSDVPLLVDDIETTISSDVLLEFPSQTDYPNSTSGFGEVTGELGTITVVNGASVAWSSGRSLTLNADNDIILNGPVSPNGGTLNLVAANRAVMNGDLTLGAGGALNVTAGADAVVTGQDTIMANGSTITMNADSIDIGGDFVATGSTVVLNATNDILIDNSNPFTATGANVTMDANVITIARQLDTAGGSLDLTADNNITITTAGSIEGTGGDTALQSDGFMVIDGPILTPGGDLSVRLLGSGNAVPGPGGEVNVGQFRLIQGGWFQNGGSVAPADFNAANFIIDPSPGAEFLRVLSGDGSSTPYSVADIYGLQGVGTLTGAPSFELANTIDASPTAGWSAFGVPGVPVADGGFAPFDFAGTLEGNGFDITQMTVNRHSQTPGTGFGGLFGTLSGTVRNLNITGANVNGPQVGIVAAQNAGTIDGVSVTGTVRAHSTSGSPSSAGGIAGINGSGGTITESFAEVDVLDIPDPSAGGGGAEDLFIGGIAGRNQGTIARVRSDGSVTFDLPLVGRAGGIAGSSSGSVTDVYSTASVSADTNNGTSGHAGNIVGENSGTITRALASGPVSLVGGNISGGVGALVGTDSDFSGVPNIFSSFYNTDETGALPSGQDGEVDGGGIGPFDGARAKTEAELFDAQAFFDEAAPAGWDFGAVWALPLDGSDHTRLYTTDRVISAFAETPNPSFEYVGDTSGYTITGSFSGGPLDYRFNVGDSGDTSDLNNGVVFSGEDAGNVTYTFPTTFTSNQGLSYSVRQLQNNATITQRPITLSVAQTDPANPTGPTIPNSKVYGEVYTPADAVFNADVTGPAIAQDADFDTAFFADPNSLLSAGLPATAPVSGSPYTLDINPLTFTGGVFDNYDITFTPATLSVNLRPLTIDVDDASKVEGTELIFAGTEFATMGLVNGDDVTSLIITSLGAPASAPISGSPYSIDGTSPAGTGLANYDITINPGVLTITGAPPQQTLDIFVSNLTKTYGETLNFSGTEFTTTGLQPGDSVTSLTIASEGAAAGAPVAGSPYVITGSNPVGSGLGNYAITIIPGQLVVVPAPLIVTADDQNKPFGDTFVFTGNEFTVSGLVNGDTVTSATITSVAAPADAPFTGPEGAAIVISDPVGTGLENYNITLVNGVMIIAPNNLIITANNQEKVYGTDFVFDGTEFTVTGLAPGDSVDSVTLTSAGAAGTAQVADGPFTIVASNAMGTNLDRYTLVFADGTFTVVPAPLTVTADNQIKQQGETFTFAGTEFTTSGLLNADSVDNAVLTSAGAASGASADDSPFVIEVGSVTGSGLSNYNITTANGSFVVENNAVVIPPVVPPVSPVPPLINPILPAVITIPNPTDTVSIAFPGSEGGVQTLGGGGTGGPQQTLPDAERTLDVVDTISTELEQQVRSCGSADEDFTNYMSCLSDQLDTYANALDEIINDLPAGMETVSATIRTARASVDAATTRATRRLATATTAAQRQAIRREAVNEARAAIDTAKTEIRKAITLIRADDPEVEAVQRQTGARIVQAFDTVDTALVRAVEL